MRTILVDGSNVSLYSAPRGRLTTIECLARVIRCLLANGIVPYTVFDASFRYKTSEDSVARKDFGHLTRGLSEFFLVAPSGEQADLFLLELAVVNDQPVLSNDIFKEYGGVRDGVIRYRGVDVSVYNFAVFAGAVIMPDLDVRRRILPEDGSFENLDQLFAAALAPPEERAVQSAASADPQLEIDAKTVSAIGEILRGYVADGGTSLAPLGNQLNEQKVQFLAASGAGKNSKRAWFGFPTLRMFLAGTYPQYSVGENWIKAGAGPASEHPTSASDLLAE